MIKAGTRSITTIFLGVLCSFSATLQAEPFSVIEKCQEHLKSVSYFSAPIERYQTYRNIQRTSSGMLYYDKRYGSLYDWKTPGKYRFFRSSFGAFGADLTKKYGWKTEFGTPNPTFSRHIDPLYRILDCLVLTSSKVNYQGNNGDLLIFAQTSEDDSRRFLGFDALTFRCTIIETADATGKVFEKTKFYYSQNPHAAPIPEAIVITSQVGEELSVDSICIQKPDVSTPVKRERFTIPQQITWHNQLSTLLPE